ncbi:SLAM family member 9-like [Pteropus medius]|uniref:SLAM family member 9-like n=1 Tax=Pteropus vampyrus TaxID=132908 RepID=UPI00196B6C37|nr:SLAM family member 9-like [Pteropus giganteus]
MSGRYTAKTKFKSGKSLEEAFRLCLYEPIPHPQIQVHSSSSTMGRCNVSLECASPGTTGDLTVTWLSKDFPEEPGQRGVLESATSSRHLSLSLPWDQLDGHLTCVVSNPVDRKNVTLHLESVCLRRGSLQSKWLVWSCILVVLMVSLGAGIWTWRKRRKMEAGRGESALSAAAPQALVPEETAGLQSGGADGHEPPPYAEITWPRRPKKGPETASGHSPGAKDTPEVHTIYQKI